MNINIGLNITQNSDILQSLLLEELIHKIKSPKDEFQNQIEQLRITRTIDVNRYNDLKIKLPYFTCGHFYPPIRRKENFAFIQCFVVDLDHLSANGIDITELKNTLIKDEMILAFFVSPSGDGLKVLFKLREKCKDSSLFSAFYNLFSIQFAQRYHLSNVIDTKTHDVTRACFISFDENAYYNEHALEVDLAQYINPLNYDESEKQLKEAKIFIDELEKSKPNEIITKQQLDDSILQKIKSKLNPSLKTKPSKSYFVPTEIDELIPLISSRLNEFDITLDTFSPINYGMQLKVKAGIYWSELNIFYGKKGYSIVQTTKTGSNKELAGLAHQIIYELINPTIN
jgi:hypothetical protein